MATAARQKKPSVKKGGASEGSRRRAGSPPVPPEEPAEVDADEEAGLEVSLDAEPAEGGGRTVQTSIRLSRYSNRLLDGLVARLNEIREEGTEPWTRTQVLELALRDYWPAWRESMGLPPEAPGGQGQA